MTDTLKTEGSVTYLSRDLNPIKITGSTLHHISIAGFEPISSVSLHVHNSLGGLMEKVNEVVERMNSLTELVTKHIIGGK